jgi:hypothetical protein
LKPAIIRVFNSEKSDFSGAASRGFRAASGPKKSEAVKALSGFSALILREEAARLAQ